MEASRVLLEYRNVWKSFPGVIALRDVSFDLRDGEVLALCGENGAGKSTIIKLAGGIYPSGSYEGHIVLDGLHAEFRSVRDSEKAGIAVIHQELALCPNLSIADNIFLGHERIKGGLIDEKATELAATKLLARVGLHEAPDVLVGKLGVGKQQFVEIAKALSKDARILVLDEPTSALNDEDSAHLLDLISQLKTNGVSSIIVSHKLNEIERIADRITVIRDGQVIETIPRQEITEDRIIRGMVGRDMSHRFPSRSAMIGEELLRVEDWTAFHPDDSSRKIVKSVNLSVRNGEVVGLCGLVGAGRTEFALSLFGRSYGQNISGRAYKAGQPISVRSVRDAIRSGIAYATEDRKQLGLILGANLKFNVSLAALQRLVSGGLIDDPREWSVAQGFIRDMAIKVQSAASQVSTLSGGNQQKVMLSKWMFTDADVLFLDEPTRGIDVGAKYEIYAIINRLAEQGKGVVMISSELPELLGMCDRIVVFAEGRVAGEMPAAAADVERVMQLMTKGIHT
jgi:putative multiple sugar transport system ATP-binding protein